VRLLGELEPYTKHSSRTSWSQTIRRTCEGGRFCFRHNSEQGCRCIDSNISCCGWRPLV